MSATDEKRPLPVPLLAFRLRALVLALGECVPSTWWNTEFMNETGLRFLERLYPRTPLHAAVHAAGKAASNIHDNAVGRVGVYHLFRLPEPLEAEMNQILPNTDAEFVTSFRAALSHKEKLLGLLAPLCGAMMGTDAAYGAQRIGTDKDLMTVAGIERMATVYYHAFDQGKTSFPYYAAEQVEGR